MIIYTDGSAHPNPGPGGFGVVVLDDNDNILYAYSRQFKERVTNNEMELKAILYALLNYGKENPIVYSDSSYAVNTFNIWMNNWALNGWVKSDNKIPENLVLIQTYYEYQNKGYRIDLRKVKGHNGVFWNEIVDALATGEMTPEEVMKEYGK